MKRFIPFILIMFAAPASGSDFTMPPGFPELYNQAFSLEIVRARPGIAALPPGGPFRVYLENYVEFIEILNSSSENEFNKASSNEAIRLAAIETLDPHSPYNRFLRAEILTQWAVLKLKFGKGTKGAYGLIQAYKLISVNQKEFPAFIPHYKSLGNIHVLIGSVPENYKWALKLLGIRGNINDGFSELEKATRDEIWGNEALYCSLFLKAFTARFDERDNQTLINYVNARPGDLNARFLGASISLRTQQAAQCLRILNGVPSGSTFLKYPVFHLHKGDAYLAAGDYDRAVGAYQSYLHSARGKIYIKDTHLKLYYAYRLSGSSEKSFHHFKMIPQSGSTGSDLDRNAAKVYQLISNEIPGKELLQARIALEGGYYQEASRYLKQLQPPSSGSEWLSEYHFLTGVCSHKHGQLAEAESHLMKALAISSKADWNSGTANASLHLGYVYRSGKQPARAKAYFEKALSCKTHELKNTVDIKARAALEELKSNTSS